MKLIDEIREIIPKAEINSDTRIRYISRLLEGKPSRADDPISHFCTYFLPYNTKIKKVFIVAHKKSGLWLTPGGHIEPGETLHESLTREIKEELGIINPLPISSKPLLLTITDVKRDARACEIHFDIWYFLPTDGSIFKVDMEEFHETCWVTIVEGRKLMTDENNLLGLDFVQRELFV